MKAIAHLLDAGIIVLLIVLLLSGVETKSIVLAMLAMELVSCMIKCAAAAVVAVIETIFTAQRK